MAFSLEIMLPSFYLLESSSLAERGDVAFFFISPADIPGSNGVGKWECSDDTSGEIFSCIRTCERNSLVKFENNPFLPLLLRPKRPKMQCPNPGRVSKGLLLRWQSAPSLRYSECPWLLAQLLEGRTWQTRFLFAHGRSVQTTHD